jgi:hypothetical protein
MRKTRIVRNLLGVPLAAIGLVATLLGTAAAAETPKVDSRADRLLRAMGTQLAAASKFTFRVRRTIDPALIERQGAKVPEETLITGALKRPNKLVARSVSKTYERVVVYDGSTFTLHDVKPNVYSVVALPGNVDTLVRQLHEDFEFSPPGADFLVSDPYAVLTRELQGGKYAGQETIGGAACDRLTFQEEHIDWDIWLAADTHLPVKVVVTAKAVEGKPKITVVFLELSLVRKVEETLFTFKPPQDAVKAEMARAE